MNSKNTATYNNDLSAIARTRILTDRNLVTKDQKGYNESDIFFDFNDHSILDNNFKILTIGSNDINNPYFGGFFVFSGKFPDQYPFFPPYILAKTQGKNTRFHPNYYTNGKCCLSILGTWSGPPWTSCQNLGTTSQALKSLFIDNPITQEPGFENCNDQRSINYSKVVEYRTLEIAVINVLNNPTEEFNSFLPIIEKKFIEFYPKYIEKLNLLKKYNKMKISSPIYNIGLCMDIVYNIKELENQFINTYNNLLSKHNITPSLTSNTMIFSKTEKNLNNKILKKTKKCPNESANNYDIGFTKISDNDGKTWKVIQDINKKIKLVKYSI